VGEVFFAKWNPAPLPGFFATEARGLRALAASGALRVPEVMGYGEGEGGDPGWLALEFIPQGSPAPGYGEALGRGLAALHRVGAEGDGGMEAPGVETHEGAAEGEETEGEKAGGYGWEENNYIGALPQSNDPGTEWADFWRDERILPQVERAREAGHFQGRESEELDMLLEALPRILEGAGDDGPSLLHGDLWSGNVYPGPEGEPVLIDPSVYRGHREVDLAMSELFGGLDAYQLYYLLVHVNLFGFGYVGSSMSAVRRLLAAK
jgi:fructosamine-3-kinase